MKIADVMTPLPHTVGVEQPLRVAKEMMRDHEIRHLPVLSGGRFVGILSDRDLKFAHSLEKKGDFQLTVGDVVITEAYSANPSDSVREVCLQMAKEHLGCAIVEDHGNVVGIFTTVDACKTLAEVLAA